MGAYAHANLSVNVKAAFRAAQRHGLPAPQPIDHEWGYFFTAKQVKAWHEFMCFTEHIDNETFLVAMILSEQASTYIYEQSLKAPQDRKARREFLRAATRKFRVCFS